MEEETLKHLFFYLKRGYMEQIRDEHGQFKTGMVPWNKGLTKETDERLRILGLHTSISSKGIKILTPEHKEKISQSCKGINVGSKNGMYGDKYIHSKLKLCPICCEEIYSRGMGQHMFQHYSTPKRAARNKQISTSLEKHWEKLFDLGQFERREKLYPKDWTSNLREFIRNSYFRLCFDCSVYEIERHHIHLVDWDKKNLLPNNLIPLCRSCHAKRHRKGIKII